MMLGYEVAAVTQPSSKIRIERATRVPTEHLERFYERMFPARASFLNRHWRWLYRIDRDRPEWSPLVATNRNEVVGHLGLIPVTLRRGRHECSAVWFVDLAVLPEHQGREIGTALARAAMPSCPVQLGFGNSRSMSLLEKCGWTIQQQTVALRLDLRPERHPDWRTGRRKALAAALGSIARIVSRARTTSQEEPVVSPAADLDDFTRREFGSTLHVQRSCDFLKWRITDHPHAGEYALIEPAPSDGRSMPRPGQGGRRPVPPPAPLEPRRRDAARDALTVPGEHRAVGVGPRHPSNRVRHAPTRTSPGWRAGGSRR